jgi:hypothetical protein
LEGVSSTNKSNWYWSDWLGDLEVRRLTPAERGVWIDLIALAAHGTPTGYVSDAQGRPLSLEEIARVTNAGSPDAAAELINGILEKGAASRDRTGRLFNRRMVRDTEKTRRAAELSAKRAAAGFNGAAHTALKYFGKQILPRQDLRQLPGHVPRVNGKASSNKNKKLTSDSETVTAREVAVNSTIAMPTEPQQGLQRRDVASPGLQASLKARGWAE